MKIERFIEIWLREEVISPNQANEMINSINSIKKSEGNNKFVIALSIIGSILLGIGIILFIASNWWAIPKFAKILILAGATFGTHFAGYHLKYQNKNYPKIGGALIFLSSIIYGASIFLITQIYQAKGELHQLMLIWIAGVLPLVFIYQSKAIAGLTSILYIIWVGCFIKIDSNPLGYYLLSSTALVSMGGICYFSEKYSSIARTFRTFGIAFALFSLFLLSFEALADNYTLKFAEEMTNYHNAVILFPLLIIISSIFNLTNEEIIKNTSKIELPLIAITTFICLCFILYPSSPEFNAILFNIVMFCIIISTLYIGYTKDNLTLVNIGSIYLGILILARYFDFFWDLMPRSLFFIGGGIILLTGVFVYEKHKKQLKMRINSND